MTDDPRPRPAEPQRRSMRERMADAASAQKQAAHNRAIDAVRTSTNPLIDTSMTGIGGFDALDTAYSIAETGQIARIAAAAPIAATFEAREPAGVIDLDSAREHHLFLTNDEVEPSELEALAVSVWDDAGWIDAGDLRLTSGARLLGPWSVDHVTRVALGTPANLTNAWVLYCTPTRGKAPDLAMRAQDEWAQSFPDGMPVGVEYRVLLALRRMARRLGAGLRIADSGHLIEPDPDSAVSLNVYTPRWVGPADLVAVLREEFPDARDAREIMPPAPPVRSKRAEVQKIEALRVGLGPVREDVAAKIAGVRAEIARASRERDSQVVDGYAVIASVGNRSDMMIEVRTVPRPPQVLRWESWTTGTIVEYQVRWLPGGTVEAPVTGLTRSARLERLRSAADIERATSIIVATAGGSIVDEDGFLVGLEQGT